MSTKPVLRGPGGHWLKGSSGNPSGARKGPLYLARRILAETGDGQEFVTFLLDVWRNQDHQFVDRRWACEVLIERCYGKSTSSLELNVSQGESPALDLSKLSSEQLDQVHSLLAQGELTAGDND